ncbi:MAG: LysR family transcriptional regulator [Firmicutes bacterium]|nr:LysR family transcriptional regulator [Bacillota bacterium]
MNPSKYHIFCRVADLGSFTKAAAELGYTQSAVSQIVKSLEAELGTTLLQRRRDGIRLTSDGEQYFPFLRDLAAAEHALSEKQREMDGLEKSTILIDTFTSVSRNILPQLMRSFRETYPEVNFVLRQSEYASIHEDLLAGRVDLGFISIGAGPADGSMDSAAGGAPGIYPDLQMQKLYDDEMVAVLPPEHPLARRKRISLADLADETFILMDEGAEYNTALEGFRRAGLTPNIGYEVYDDYTIMSMIRQGLGVSLLFRRVVHGFSEGVAVRELSARLTRPVYLAWKNRDTLPIAARRFADYILSNIESKAESKNFPKSQKKG